jgi:hypothetical protein
VGCKSDHLPLCVQFGEGDLNRRFVKKKFKIEASWMHDDEYLEVVHEAWTNMENIDLREDPVQQKLKRCQTKLQG